MLALSVPMLCATLAMTACARPGVRAFGGAWQPANRFPDHAERLPLHVDYVYFVTPTDGTLRGLLGRWARDTGRELAYRAAYDLTLHEPAAAIRTPDVQTAASRLNALYAAAGVTVSITAMGFAVEASAPEATPARTAGVADKDSGRRQDLRGPRP